ncbi:outer membrane beta-barrel protein [Stenotrophomonas maltophilia]|uniref:outer membrane beta-barrel protein n=1 Tax=Stenotrophomonas maltophilia TaxID=40324 RepID=UPI0015DFF623|nr:outer membrane beta-barrel protein [Stenotrophomonas maltophilia]MDZ5816377.1 outer membrane beta-barrel protein [Stenotrophomonas maltophilia]
MRMPVASLVLAPCLLLAAHASAQSTDRDGLYGFVGVGSHSVSIPASNVKPQYKNSEWKQSKIGFQTGAGYRFNDHFALEAAVFGQGGGRTARKPTQAGDTHVRSSSRGVTFSGVGLVPLGERFELFGRAGIGAMRTSLTATTVDFDHKAQSGTFALQYGLGANVRLGDRSFVRTEWTVLRPTGKSPSAAALGGDRVMTSQFNVAYGMHF